jgi:hypothetical protein
MPTTTEAKGAAMSNLAKFVFLIQTTGDALVRNAAQLAALNEMQRVEEINENERNGAAWPDICQG